MFEWFSEVIRVFPQIIISIFGFFYHWYLWVFIHVIAYRIVRNRWTLESNSFIRWTSKYIGLSILSSSVYVSLQYLTITYSGLEKSWYVLNRTSAYYFQLTFSAVSTYWAVIGLGLVIDYYKKFQTKTKHALELKAELAESNLQLLKMQLQPHFVFNTLNTIVSLIYEKPSLAENMIVYLSDFLRKTLSFSEKQLVSINEEISLLKDYINILEIRFEDQLQVKYDVDNKIKYVPNLIFQPLVENAIVHNIHNNSDRIHVRIFAEQTDRIRLKVENSIIDGFVSKESSGHGLKNTLERLNTLYSGDFNFNAFKNDMNIFVVEIDFPIKPKVNL